MNDDEMSLERFRRLLAAYGARFERWPARETAAGRALLQSSEAARSLWNEEHELDEGLDELGTLDLPARLERRLNEVPLATPQRRWRWPFGSIWAPALGWALAAAVGLSIGVYSAEEEARDSAAAGQESAITGEESELMALATGAFVGLEEER